MSRRERQKRRRRHRGHPAQRAVMIVLAVIFGGGALAVLGMIGWVVTVAESAPDINQLKPRDPGQSSVVYAADGERLGFIQSDVIRTPVADRQIPWLLKQATVAIEDRRYYHHKGVDYLGVIRAAIANVTTGKTVQGGSTLTMQLVKNIYLPDSGSQRSFTRKIKEAKLAEELEQRHTKQWILDDYLNSVAYGTLGGQTAVGVGAASQMFFDKPVAKLSLPQIALLAGLPQAPSAYNPFLDPHSARKRRHEVLKAMLSAHMITAAERAQADAAPLEVKRNSYYTARREQFFFDYVKQQLIQRYGLNTVREGGLRIYTTIDLKKQQEARQAIVQNLNEQGDPAAALVTIDPANGHILAMASSAQYGKTVFNFATQAHRQTGSAFKAMVLMTALRQGIDPATTYYNSHELQPGWLPGYPTYHVQTDTHSYAGNINLLQATAESDNTVYAQLDADVGPDNVRQTAYDMGITSHLDGLPAEGIGGLRIGVSPLEMADAYATIADGGWRNTPTAIVKVVHPDGHVDNLGNPPRKKEFSDGITAEATNVLKGVISHGTGTAANIGCPAAGKTGTTSSFTDAWFVGYTPHLSTAVWVGYPNATTSMTSVHGITVFGGTFPAQIWHDYMAQAIGSDCSDFPAPSTPFSGSPFFSHFASTGSPSTGSQSQQGPVTPAPTVTPTTPSKQTQPPVHVPPATAPGGSPHRGGGKGGGGPPATGGGAAPPTR